MAVEFLDSTDHYDVFTDITGKWVTNVINSTSSAVAPPGRGTRCLRVGDGIGVTLTYQDKWIVGAAMFFDSNQGFGSQAIYTLLAANETTIAILKTESDGTLSLYGGNQFSLIGNTGTGGTPFRLRAQRWYYIHIETKITGTTPMDVTMTLWVNGVQLLTGTGSTNKNDTDTLNQIAKANYHSFGNGTVDFKTDMRDFLIANEDGTGTVNAMFGDVKIAALFPNGDVTAGWTAVGGSGGLFNHVNPQFPETNDDTVYIKDNTPTDVADFDWQDVPAFSGAIVAVHYGAYARKDDEGSRTIQLTTQGTPNGPVVSLGDSYQYYFFAMDADPSTGVAWTQSGFNASHFGVELVS